MLTAYFAGRTITILEEPAVLFNSPDSDENQKQAFSYAVAGDGGY